MGTVSGAAVRFGGGEVVGLGVVQDVEHRLRITAAPGQDGDEQQARLGQGEGG